MIRKILAGFAYGIFCFIVIVVLSVVLDAWLSFFLWLISQTLLALKIIEVKMPYFLLFAIFFLPILFTIVYNLYKTDRWMTQAESEIYEASKKKELEP